MNDNGTYDPGAPLQERTGLTPTLRTWTVIGFWYDDEPVPVGSVEGAHVAWTSDQVDDGSPVVDGAYGGWSVQVEAYRPHEAEPLAVAEMLRIQFGEDGEDEGHEGELPSGFGDFSEEDN